MKKKKKILSIILSLALVFSFFTTSFGAVKASVAVQGLNEKRAQVMHEMEGKKEKVDPSKSAAQKLNTVTNNENKTTKVQKVNPNDNVRVIVELDGDSTYQMGKKLKLKFQQSLKLTDTVKNAQKVIISKVSKYGTVRHSYQNLLNGFSAVVKYSDINKIKIIQGVKKVTIANTYQIDMNSAVTMTNANTVWQDYGIKGEGTVVAIVDTGIDYKHKDMKLTDTAKAKLNEVKVTTLGGPGHFFSDKVPYGYNFADMSDDIYPRQSEHGMHVSGIVAANGSDTEVATNDAIKGVAPEAQLLAMKVFSNNPDIGDNAFGDDITAAIEDSVKHGADVINMSLGSTAGFADLDDPEQEAIKEATDAGVIVVVSGGNSYYSVYNKSVNYAKDPDTSVIGSPGLFTDTIQVASFENNKILLNMFEFAAGANIGTIPYMTSDVDPVGVLNGDFQMIDCNIGQPSDFAGKDLTGKIALIQRGVISFVEKKLNAQAAGAVGAIIYNNKNDASYVNMATDPSIKIPGIFVTYADGLKLKGLISSGVNISFKGAKGQAANALANNMSDFSSWGPTPDLEFKPEVTAPGGNIWSTIPNNKYENMSGTSMSSPHTAGAMALIVQNLKSKYNNAGNRDFVALAKALIINSAEPIIDPSTGNEKLPYLTRKQGAGLIKIDKAIKTKAYVTDGSGKATIALKSIGTATNFKLKITNFGNEELTFTPTNPNGILTSKISERLMYQYAMNIPNASMGFDKTSVTVPAGGSAEIKATLNIPGSTRKDIFAEGFITLKCSDESKNPSIGIPFMGFYGDWSDPEVFDAPIWDGYNTFFGRTTLIDGNYYLGQVGEDTNGPIIDPQCISISTENQDGYMDVVLPYVDLMRNAKEMKVQIYDADNKLIREIGLDNNVRKTYFDGNAGAPTDPANNMAWAWDGTVYNQSTNKYELVKDGAYTVRLLGKADGCNTYSTLDMPVKVDNLAPEFSVTGEKSEGKYKLTLNGSDNVGIQSYGIFINDNSELDQIIDGTEKSCIVDLPYGQNQITVVAMDYAGNTSMKSINIDNTSLKVVPLDGFTKVNDILYSNSSVNIGYSIDETIKSMVEHYSIVKDNEAAINNGLKDNVSFSDLTEGKHSVDILAVDVDGKTIAKGTLEFITDTQVPIINISDPVKELTVLPIGIKQYTIKMQVLDTSGFILKVDGKQIPDVTGEIGDGTDTEKSYEYTVNVPDDGCSVKIEAIDKLSHSFIKTLTFVHQLIDITSPSEGKVVFGKTVTVTGKIHYTNNSQVALEICNKIVTVNAEGGFSQDITLDNYGNNIITVKASLDGAEVESKAVNVTCTAFKFDNGKVFSNGEPGTSVKVDYSLADNSIDHVTVALDNKEPVNVGLNTTVTVSTDNLSSGMHVITFMAYDASNTLMASDSVQLEVNKAVPAVNIPNLANVPIINAKEYEIAGNAGTKLLQALVVKTGEPIANVLQSDIKLDGDNNHFSGMLKNLHDGLNRIEVTMTDIYGNTNKYEYKLYVDTTPPILDITPSNDNISLTSDTYTIKMHAQDNVAGYRLYVNGNQIGYAASETYDGRGTDKNFEYKIGVPEGNSTVSIKIVDVAGNEYNKLLKFARYASEQPQALSTDYTLSVTGGSGTGSYKAYSTVTVSAKAEEGYFAGWMDESKNIISYDTNYSFIMTRDMIIKATFSDEAVTPVPIAVLDNNVVFDTSVPAHVKMFVLGTFTVPEGYKIDECGFISLKALTDPGDKLTLENSYVTKVVAPGTNQSGQVYRVIFTNDSSSFFVRGYVKYEKIDSNEKVIPGIIYSNVVQGIKK